MSSLWVPRRALLRKLAVASIATLLVPSAGSLWLAGRARAQASDNGPTLEDPGRLMRSSVHKIAGGGFQPGEIVRLSLNSDDTPLGHTVAGPDGSFKTSVTIPEDAKVGTNSVIATGADSGARTQVSVPVVIPPLIIEGSQTVSLATPGNHLVTIPTGATSVKITAYGAQGGEGGWPGGAGGLGAIIEGTLKLTASDTDMTVVVGGAGHDGAKADGTCIAVGNSAAGGGGGGSFVWLGTSDPPDETSKLLIVAGGGGGGGGGQAQWQWAPYGAYCGTIITGGRHGNVGRTSRAGGAGDGAGSGAGGSGSGAGAGGEGGTDDWGGGGGGGWAIGGGDGGNGARGGAAGGGDGGDSDGQGAGGGGTGGGGGGAGGGGGGGGYGGGGGGTGNFTKTAGAGGGGGGGSYNDSPAATRAETPGGHSGHGQVTLVFYA